MLVQRLLKRRGLFQRLLHGGALRLGLIQTLDQRLVLEDVPGGRGERLQERLLQPRELHFEVLLHAEQVALLLLQRGLLVLDDEP